MGPHRALKGSQPARVKGGLGPPSLGEHVVDDSYADLLGYRVSGAEPCVIRLRQVYINSRAKAGSACRALWDIDRCVPAGHLKARTGHLKARTGHLKAPTGPTVSYMEPKGSHGSNRDSHMSHGSNRDSTGHLKAHTGPTMSYRALKAPTGPTMSYRALKGPTGPTVIHRALKGPTGPHWPPHKNPFTQTHQKACVNLLVYRVSGAYPCVIRQRQVYIGLRREPNTSSHNQEFPRTPARCTIELRPRPSKAWEYVRPQ
jgi:hypothetical protein